MEMASSEQKNMISIDVIIDETTNRADNELFAFPHFSTIFLS